MGKRHCICVREKEDMICVQTPLLLDISLYLNEAMLYGQCYIYINFHSSCVFLGSYVF